MLAEGRVVKFGLNGEQRGVVLGIGVETYVERHDGTTLPIHISVFIVEVEGGEVKMLIPSNCTFESHNTALGLSAAERRTLPRQYGQRHCP